MSDPLFPDSYHDPDDDLAAGSAAEQRKSASFVPDRGVMPGRATGPDRAAPNREVSNRTAPNPVASSDRTEPRQQPSPTESRRPQLEQLQPLLTAHGVTRVFSTPAGDRVANDHIDLAVRPGELVVLAGPSGAGKTTLLNLLAGLDRPTAGDVVLAGKKYAELGDRELSQLRREYIGYVFQAFGLLPMLSARENVEVPLRLLRTAPAERDARVIEVLDEVGLTGHLDQRPYELSGGQQQRVSLARALVARPRLLLADEPTAQLDSATAGNILELIQHLVHRLGVAAVVTTHDETLINMADRVVHLHDGIAIEMPGTGSAEASGGRHARNP